MAATKAHEQDEAAYWRGYRDGANASKSAAIKVEDHAISMVRIAEAIDGCDPAAEDADEVLA